MTQAPPQPKRAVRLTARDYDLLQALGIHRFLSVPQVSALYFGNEATTTSRLRKLADAGLTTRVFVPVRPYDRKSHTVFALGASGAREVAAHTGEPAPRFLTEREHRSGLFLAHTLARSDLFVCLELLSRERPGFQLLSWKHAPEDVASSALVRVRRGAMARVPLVPDAFFAAKIGPSVFAFVVEVDMGTVSLARMALRYRGYLAWWKGGGGSRLAGTAPLRVLTLTTTPRHVEALRRVAQRGAGNGNRGSNLFWFAQLELADLRDPSRLLTGAWTTAGDHGERPRPLIHEPSNYASPPVVA